MKKQESEDLSTEPQEQKEPTSVTYKVEDVNNVLVYLSSQKFSEVAGLINDLKTKGELS